MSYSVPLNLVVVLSFIIFVFYLLGVHNILTNLGENDCDMTYMFEFPQFVEISLPASVHRSYPRYALFGYAEGGHTEKLRQMKFRGIPVLFIPGSSGSYKQGRSLASVSLRKALNSRTSFYFDYFMVDFSEEQSALYGGVLNDEITFVRHCIMKILSFYSKEPGFGSSSVILIGHSLGGLIAKAVFVDPDFNKESVNLIIALAAPLKNPVIQPDPYFADFYKDVDLCWKNSSRVSHATLVSIGGGKRDVLVRSDLTNDGSGDVNVLSTAVPGVWCSMDHLSIVWCRQLVLTVVRAIFDCIDLNTKQLTMDKNTRLSVWKYHLLQRSAGKKFATNRHLRFATFDREGYWFENMLRQFTVIDPKSTKANNYIMIHLYQEANYEFGFIESFNLNIKDWVYVCSANTMYKSVRICENGENLSNLTEIAPVPPSSRLKRKFVYLNLFELKAKDFTHVIVKVPKMDSFVQVNVDVHSSDRVVTCNVPSMYSMSKQTVIEKTDENSVYYKVNLMGFESIWQGFNVVLEALTCKTAKNNALLSFMIPWGSHHYHFHMKDSKSISGRLTLTTAKPGNRSDYPFLRLNLDPTCRYKVTIRPSIPASASQIVLYFTGALPAYIATVLLLTIREQVLHLESGECVFFHSALCSAVRRYYFILQATVFGSKLFGLGAVLRFLPVPDFFALEDFHLDFFVMSIILYGVAIIIAYSCGIACYASVVISGKAAHKMALKFIAKTITGFVNWSQWVLTILHQVPILVSTMLVSLALSTSGALSLALGAIFYFLKICNMYEDYLEEIFHYSIKLIAEKVKDIAKLKESSQSENASEKGNVEKKECEDRSDAASPAEVSSSDEEVALSEQSSKEVDQLSALHFHVTLFLLWSSVAMLHVPSLLVWARNYHHKAFLGKDPAMIPSLILNVCGAVLWQSGVPHSYRKFSGIISKVLFILAAVSIIYSSVSLYRLSYVICGAVMVLTVNQLAAKYSSR